MCPSLSHLPLDILQALEKLGPSCLINLTPTQVCFYLTNEWSSGEQAFVEAPVEGIFDNLQIQSKNRNEIPFIISVGNLLRALKSGETVEQIIIKLSKKNERPFLSFEMLTHGVSITQDIPIVLQGPQKVADCSEPDIPPPEVKFHMPKLKCLQHVVDRMKTVSNELIVEASSTGEISFSVESDSVEIKTFYKGLAFQSENESPLVTARARMDIKKFAKVLTSKVLAASFTIGCIVERHAFVLHLILQQNLGTVTFYIPLIAD
jgi:hypothetical protein